MKATYPSASGAIVDAPARPADTHTLRPLPPLLSSSPVASSTPWPLSSSASPRPARRTSCPRALGASGGALLGSASRLWRRPRESGVRGRRSRRRGSRLRASEKAQCQHFNCILGTYEKCEPHGASPVNRIAYQLFHSLATQGGRTPGKTSFATIWISVVAIVKTSKTATIGH